MLCPVHKTQTMVYHKLSNSYICTVLGCEHSQFQRVSSLEVMNKAWRSLNHLVDGRCDCVFSDDYLLPCPACEANTSLSESDVSGDFHS
jgi:hypothetical protein